MTGAGLPLDQQLDQKLHALGALIRGMGEVLVTFSGGVDSALVLKVAVDTLGDRALALTADSPTFPAEECAEARRFAAEIGARHLVVAAHELEREGYARNTGDRCYFCKTELFDLARATAEARGIPWILDGTIVDDLQGHRPGLRAAAEHAVRHPLVEAGFTKADVRAAARALGMPVWDKPSFACLGSRFSVGTRVTLGRVTRVGRIESTMRAHGFRQFRVRFHDLGGTELLRIEVEIGDLARLVAPGVREDIVASCRAEGFSWITLDLEGFRTGSTSGAHPSAPSASGTASTTSPPALGSGSSSS
ncbi:MAG: ATP-dependent sacrificial sulfur transferase LarE [Pseudomonadota bacterium]|nr:ATP-dependent sacrificial sulfur transferase LarE [Pseudomonadota bacterium]